jgi:hypothetical protein
MGEHEQNVKSNERLWNNLVKEECGFTKPFLDLNADDLRAYAAGGPRPWEERGVSLDPCL